MRVKEHNRRGKLPDQKGDVSKVVLEAKPDVKARAAAWNSKRSMPCLPTFGVRLRGSPRLVLYCQMINGVRESISDLRAHGSGQALYNVGR